MEQGQLHFQCRSEPCAPIQREAGIESRLIMQSHEQDSMVERLRHHNTEIANISKQLQRREDELDDKLRQNYRLKLVLQNMSYIKPLLDQRELELNQLNLAIDRQNQLKSELAAVVEKNVENNFGERLEQSKQHLNDLRNQASQATVTNQQMEKRLKDKRQRLDSMVDRHVRLVSEVKLNIEELARSLQELRVRNSTIERQSGKLNGNCEIIAQQLKNKERESQELADSTNDLKDKISEINSQIQCLCRETSDLRNQLVHDSAEHETDLETEITAQKNLRKLLAQTRISIEEAELAKKQSKRNLGSKGDGLGKVIAQSSSLKKKLDASKQSQSKNSQTIKQLQQQLASIKDLKRQIQDDRTREQEQQHGVCSSKRKGYNEKELQMSKIDSLVREIHERYHSGRAY